jgi:hypothetical protein
VLDLGRPVPVAAVVFEVDDRPWIARPRLEVSADAISWKSVPSSASLADAALGLYRDPRHGRGEVRFAAVEARYLRLEAALPARAGSLGVRP